MESRDVLVAIRRGWWLVLLGTAFGIGCALLFSLIAKPLYSSSTQLFVSTTNSSSTADVFQGGQFSQDRVTSYAQLLQGTELADRVVRQLGLSMSAEQLSTEVSATPVTNTVLLDVVVTDRSPQRSRDIAAAIGQQFPVLVRELETPDANGGSPVKVTVTEAPQVPSGPSSPHTIRNLLLGLLGGIVVGVAVAILRAQLDRSIRNPEELAGLSGSVVIGTVLRDDALRRGHTFAGASSARTAEDYRQLRANLQFLNVDAPPRVIVVSSALPEEGKTTLVINLALALAEAGQRVTVVEADLRRPKVTRYLGMVGGVGLTNVLAGTATLDEVTQVFREGMSVVAAGPTPPNPGELLASSQMASALAKLRAENDIVLIDSPPLLPVADTSGLAVHADGVLLSVRYGVTRKDQVKQTAVTLERIGAKTLGLVLNIVPPKAEITSAYGYGYGYEDSAAAGGAHLRRAS